MVESVHPVAHTSASDQRRAPLVSLPARLAARLVRLYQLTFSPALVLLNPTCGCRFSPTCSHYAHSALQRHGLFRGGFLVLKRLAKCGPWHPGGEDLVPPAGRRPTCQSIPSRSSLVTPHSSS